MSTSICNPFINDRICELRSPSIPFSKLKLLFWFRNISKWQLDLCCIQGCCFICSMVYLCVEFLTRILLIRSSRSRIDNIIFQKRSSVRKKGLEWRIHLSICHSKYHFKYQCCKSWTSGWNILAMFAGNKKTAEFQIYCLSSH